MNTKMYIKYIIFFSFTYFIPMETTITTQEIENLWDKIRPVDKEYIVLKDFENYLGQDTMDVKEIMAAYGLSFLSEEDEVESMMLYEHFEEAASKGLIPRWSRLVMYTEFRQLITHGENREYVTLDDMIRYYVPRYTVPYLEQIMEKYGTMHGNQRRVEFLKFRIAMCIGDLPKPSFENGYGA